MQPGQVIGGYRIERTLGQGGMGAVFLARRPGQGPVALKLLLSAVDPEVLARFEREAHVLQQLSSLGIVRCLDYGLERGRPYIVQEFCEGGDLSGLLRTRGRLEPREAASLVQSLCAALEVAHRAGVVHRDVKPANVLLDEGQPKLTDFGLARAKGIDHRSLTATGVFLGTPAYMAPEQLLDAREVDRRSDVYAMGVILFELVSGYRPFQGATALGIADAVLNRSPHPLPAHVPAEFQAVVLRAMSREPAERFDSAQDMADALVGLSGAAEPEERPALLLPLLALSVLLLGVLVGLFALSAPAPELPTPSSATDSSPALSPSGPLGALASTTTGPLGEALEACAYPETRAEGARALKALADTGAPRACLAYGRLLLGGIEGGVRDPVRAKPYLERAARGPLPEAEVWLSRLGPPESWAEEQRKVWGRIYKRASKGDRVAILFVLGRLQGAPRKAQKAFEEAARDPGPVRDLGAFLRFGKGSPGEQARISKRLRASRSPEAALVRAALALRTQEPRAAEPDLRRLLEEAYAAGYTIAAQRLGSTLRAGSLKIEGACEVWLRRAAIHGHANTALALWASFPEEQLWVRLAAAKGNPRASLAYAEELIRVGPPFPTPVEPWLEHAAAQGRSPRASALLAVQIAAQPDLRPGGLARAEALAKHGLSTAARQNFESYGRVLARRVGPYREERAWAALEVLAGLASVGDDASALRAAQVSTELGFLEVTRSLLRRALTIPAAGKVLERIAEEIPATAPVGSQSQIVLQGRAETGDRPAIIELGRRADLELLGEPRYRALSAAAATGDLRSRLRLARLQVTSGHRHSRRAEALKEFESIAKAGLPEGWLLAVDYGMDATRLFGRIGVEARLRAAAKRGNTNGMYALGLSLVRTPRKVREGRRWLVAARARGDARAAHALAKLSLKGPDPVAALAALEAQAGQDHLAIGLAYLETPGIPRDLARARRHLLLAALLGGPPEAYGALGRALSLGPDPGPSVGTLWLEAADLRGDLASRFALGKLYLERPEFGRAGVGLMKLEKLMREEKDVRARLLVGRTYLEGEGSLGNLPLAEKTLKVLQKTSPEARALLAGVCLRTNRGSEGRATLEREVAAGNPHARVILATSWLEGVGGPLDKAQGLGLLSKGVERQESQSCELLGNLYLEGQHVEREQGSGEALLRLAERLRDAERTR